MRHEHRALCNLKNKMKKRAHQSIAATRRKQTEIMYVACVQHML